MSLSKYICARCGLPVREWGNGWKHSGGTFSHSCGKIPRLMLRTEYEKQIQEALGVAKGFVQQQVGPPRMEKFNNRQSSFASKKGEENGKETS